MLSTKHDIHRKLLFAYESGYFSLKIHYDDKVYNYYLVPDNNHLCMSYEIHNTGCTSIILPLPITIDELQIKLQRYYYDERIRVFDRYIDKILRINKIDTLLN